MLQALYIFPASVQTGTPPRAYVGHIFNRTPGTVLAMPDDAGGRFLLGGDGTIMTGYTATDFNYCIAHVIKIKETDIKTGSHLYTVIQIMVDPQPYVGTPIAPPPVYHSGGILSAPTIPGSQIVRGTIQGAAPPSPQVPPAQAIQNKYDQLIEEAYKRVGEAFTAEEVYTPPKNFRPRRAHIAMYSEADACQRQCEFEVSIAGEGVRKATHLCLPEDREEYRAQWPDAIVLGVAVFKEVDNG